MTRPIRLRTASLICSALLFGTVTAQAAYPDKPVHMVVGFSAGGGSDILTRQISSALSEVWGQPVLVENRPGANGTIAANYVAHSAPDGYTLIMVTNPHAMPAAPGTTLTYDPVKSFAPASLIDTKPMILIVNPSFPAKSVKELVAMAKSKPGQLNYGSDGPASNPSMFMRMFLLQTGTKMTEISYGGGGETQVAVLGGEVQMTFGTPQAALEQIRAGKLRALAVTTNVRSTGLPDVPTMAEAADLPHFNAGSWNGILAPAGTPQAIVDKISADVVVILKKPAIAKSFADQGIIPIASTPAAFTTFIAEEVDSMTALFKTFDIK